MVEMVRNMFPSMIDRASVFSFFLHPKAQRHKEGGFTKLDLTGEDPHFLGHSSKPGFAQRASGFFVFWRTRFLTRKERRRKDDRPFTRATCDASTNNPVSPSHLLRDVRVGIESLA